MFKFLIGVIIGVYGRDVIKSTRDKQSLATYQGRLEKAYRIVRYGTDSATISPTTFKFPFSQK